jgi:hypothetical protein
MTKPLIASAAKARWADLAGTTDLPTGYTYDLGTPNVLSLLERPDILPFSAPYFGDLADFAYNRVDPAVRDPRFADVTLDHLLRHRAGFCRQTNIPGLRYSPTTPPGGIGVPPPEPDEPPVQPGRSPLAQLGTGFTVQLVGAVNLSVAAGSGVTQGDLPFGAAALELNRARLVVLSDLLMACFETAGNDPLERQSCIDEAVWDHRAIFRFVMGTTLVFVPGATNSELDAAMGTPDQENRCAENYSNVGHLLIGHLIAASYGDTYFSDPGDAPALWGPSAKRPLEYLRTFLTSPNPAASELFAIDASLPTGQTSESWQEPFYRGLDPTTGEPRRASVVFANPAFSRWNDGSTRWEFCRTTDEASCLASRDTFPAHPDWSTTHAPAMRAYVHDVGYGGAAGFAATARAYSALANRHIAASSNDDLGGSPVLVTWGEAAGQRWTSTPNLPAPKTFGHGGSLAGTATSTNNVLAGARLTVTTPSFDPATSPTWNLDGPILSPPQNAIGEATTTTSPASCPSLPFVIPGLPPPPACNTCTIAEDLQWVLLMNQGDDPTAVDGTSYGRRNDLVRDAPCRLETSGDWPAPLSPVGLDQLGGTP